MATTDGENGTAEPNEHSSLLHEHLVRFTTNEEGQPLYKDGRAWVRYPAMTAHITWEILRSNYVNILLVFVPLGIIAGALKWNPTAVFILNFLAIIPLASLLAFTTEELAVPLGQTIGGLLNATFGNAVELIVRCHISRFHSTQLTASRSASLHSVTTKSGLCRLACLVVSCQTFSSSSVVASSLVAFRVAS